MTDLDAILERLERTRAAFRIDSLRPQFDAVADALRDRGVVDVAVLGAFKAGKSSFLNALVGRDVMPVDVLPATAVVTRVVHGPGDRVLVRALSGAVAEVPVDRLAEFVTERQNPGNGKQVALVDVELAALAAYEGIRFVDTPGLGSSFAHNTRTALDFLPRVGGALLAVSVSHPLAEQDVALLRDVSRQTPEVAVLLTKADLVTESQRDAVVEFLHREIVRHTGRELPILPFSVLPPFTGLRDAVRDHLLRRIVERRAEAHGAIVGHKIRGLVAGCRDYLLVARAAADAAGRARADLEAVLRREEGDVAAIAAEVALFVRDISARVRTASGERFHADRGEVVARLLADLERKMPEWTGNLARATRDYRAWLEGAMAAEMSRLSPRGEAHLAAFLVKARASLQRTVRAFQARLAGEVEKALGVSFAGARFDAGVAAPEEPDVRLGRTFDSHVELLWFLVPMALFRPAVFRRFRSRIPWEAEKNLSRLSAQWADAVNAPIASVARQSVDFVREEIATVARLVSAAGDRRAEIAHALKTLDELEEGLDRP